MDIFEILKYLIGTLPGVLFAAWKFYQEKRGNDLIDYKDVMEELKLAYAEIIEMRKSISNIVAESESKSVLIQKLQNELSQLK